MLKAIGIMIGFYIFAKCIEMIKKGGAIEFFGALAGVVCILCTIVIIFS
jgi:hypothetical protein